MVPISVRSSLHSSGQIIGLDPTLHKVSHKDDRYCDQRGIRGNHRRWRTPHDIDNLQRQRAVLGPDGHRPAPNIQRGAQSIYLYMIAQDIIFNRWASAGIGAKTLEFGWRRRCATCFHLSRFSRSVISALSAISAANTYDAGLSVERDHHPLLEGGGRCARCSSACVFRFLTEFYGCLWFDEG